MHGNAFEQYLTSSGMRFVPLLGTRLREEGKGRGSEDMELPSEVRLPSKKHKDSRKRQEFVGDKLVVWMLNI